MRPRTAAAEVEKRIQADQQDILNVVRAVSLLRTIPPSTMELVTGYGEVALGLQYETRLKLNSVLDNLIDKFGKFSVLSLTIFDIFLKMF